MKRLALTLLAACALPAWGGGIDRSGQGLGALFEPGRQIELSFRQVVPEIRGEDRLGGSTGDTGRDYSLPGASVKFDAGERLSFALLFEQTYGADILYDEGSLLLGGTRVDVRAHSLAGLARYRLDPNFSVHGGVRVQNAHADVRLKGLAYGPLNGYHLHLGADTAVGTIAGLAWERPEIALRIAATYHGPVEHRLNTREQAPLAPLNGQSTTMVRTPRALNLDVQTGIAAGTLLFGQLRWVRWSEFRVDPLHFRTLTGEGLIDLEDTRTWTLGLAREFTPRWAGAVSLHYKARGNEFNSPLSPTNGRQGLTLAAIYREDRLRITTSLSYLKLGDARLETGTPDTQRATMQGNSALVLGMTLGYGF